MPRYVLEPSARLLPSHSVQASSTPGKAVDLGQFWFNGYAVSIRLLGNGKLRAQRVVKDAPGEGVLRKLVYWLRTMFDAEGGRGWNLNQRDGAAVLSQRMAEYRNASLADFMPGSPDVIETPAPARDGAANLLSLSNAAPALDCVIEHLNLRDRTALGLTHQAMQRPIKSGLEAERDFRWAMREANGVRTLHGLKELAARYDLDGSGSTPTGTLWPRRKVEVLGALASRLAALPPDDRPGAARHLLGLAARLPDRIRRQGQLTLLMCTPKGQRAEIGAAIVPDKAAYTALAAALTPTQRQEGLRALTEAFMASAGAAAELRASRWEALLADAKATAAADPALAAEQFAALAVCLKEVESGEPASRGGKFGATAIANWHKLRQELNRLPQGVSIVLACALARCLWHFDEGQGEYLQALALLQNWQGKTGLTSAQDVALSLALLNRVDKAEQSDSWSRAWDRIEAERLVDQGKEAVRLLPWVLTQERCERVVAFCRAGIQAYPNQCADMLLALIDVLDKEREIHPSLDKPDVRSAIHEVALALLERGGPAAPLLQCRGVPKDEILASIRTHVPWPARAQVLAQWLEIGKLRDNMGQELSELLPALEPELNELVAMTRTGATEQTCDACARALTALARRCDQALLAKGGGRSALQVAEALLPLVRGMREGDTAAAVAALAQLVNSIALLRLHELDPAQRHRLEMLQEGTWALSRRLSSAGRQAMLLDLIALKAPAPPPHDTRRNPHFWTRTTLLHAVQAVADDLPAAASILADLISAEFMVDGVADYKEHFDDLRKRIWTKVMTLPDHQFVEVAERMAMWFSRAPDGPAQARAWREARSAFVARVQALPADPYGPVRARIEYWTKLF